MPMAINRPEWFCRFPLRVGLQVPYKLSVVAGSRWHASVIEPGAFCRPRFCAFPHEVSQYFPLRLNGQLVTPECIRHWVKYPECLLVRSFSTDPHQSRLRVFDPSEHRRWRGLPTSLVLTTIPFLPHRINTHASVRVDFALFGNIFP